MGLTSFDNCLFEFRLCPLGICAAQLFAWTVEVSFALENSCSKGNMQLFLLLCPRICVSFISHLFLSSSVCQCHFQQECVEIRGSTWHIRQNSPKFLRGNVSNNVCCQIFAQPLCKWLRWTHIYSMPPWALESCAGDAHTAICVGRAYAKRIQ